MKDRARTISFLEAREIAEKAALLNLGELLKDASLSLLGNDYLEAENCWMFFRNREIVVPPEASLRGDWAYAVSKHGQVRDVPDLSEDREKLFAYLEKMSSYFGSVKRTV